MSLILKDINLKVVKSFVDDINIKRLYINYDGKEALFNIIKRESRTIIRLNYTDKKYYRERERYCQLKLT